MSAAIVVLGFLSAKLKCLCTDALESFTDGFEVCCRHVLGFCNDGFHTVSSIVFTDLLPVYNDLSLKAQHVCYHFYEVLEPHVQTFQEALRNVSETIEPWSQHLYSFQLPSWLLHSFGGSGEADESGNCQCVTPSVLLITFATAGAGAFLFVMKLLLDQCASERPLKQKLAALEREIVQVRNEK